MLPPRTLLDGSSLDELRCSRCGAAFGDETKARARSGNSRPSRERLLEHAQRDHDLDEAEALTLLKGGNVPATSAR